jgi:hypothetical protein
VLTLRIACVWIKAKISCGFSTPLRSRKKWFKGTVARDGFGFWWHECSVQGLNRGRGQFLYFLGAPMILWCKQFFFRG